MGILISIDNGGTLTDACAVHGGALYHAKALTTPYDLTKCFLDVLTRLSGEIYGGEDLVRLLSESEHIRYSTTQGTNAVVERKGPMLGLLLSRGYDPAALTGTEPERHLFEVVVGDRVQHLDANADDDTLAAQLTQAVNDLVSAGAGRIVLALGGNDVAADEARVRRLLNRRFPRHLLGAVPILLSSELVELGDDRRRIWSSILNSFLHPSIDTFLYGAESALRDRNLHKPLLIYRNDDNSTRVAKTVALKTYSSGPRGGLAGTEAFARHYGHDEVVMMDIGGTSTDIGCVHQGRARENLYGDVEGIPVSMPMMEVRSVGAGGGSVMRVADGAITVGPESVGALPGPACFGQGGTEATVTDAYLVLGYLDPATYLRGTLKLDVERARNAIERNVAEPLGRSVEEAALAIVEAYDRKIADSIVAEAKPKAGAVMLAFGGGGPIAACTVAERAGIGTVLIPRMAAVFSAFGIGFSDIAHSYESTVEPSAEALAAAFDKLRTRAERDIFAEGFTPETCAISASLVIVRGDASEVVELADPIRLPKQAAGADELRLRLRVSQAISKFALSPGEAASGKAPKPQAHRNCLEADGRVHDAAVFRLDRLQPGNAAEGPALVEDDYFTCRIPAGWTFQMNSNRDLVAQRRQGG
ncbi:MAG: hydantoinase/oxoprolinase family protein [Nevskiales bacterium]|nr:hydantoinase/oxoprolinase family protein [Nevskiales bacterium]